MDENLLREIAAEYLVPLFSGARLESTAVASSSRDALVGLVDPCTIQFKTDKTDSYRLVIKRSQKFSTVTGGVLAESHVVGAFVEVVNEIKSGLTAIYRADLLATFQRRVVAKAIAPADMQQTLLAGLDQMTMWASRLYEGKPIATTFGFTPRRREDAFSRVNVTRARSQTTEGNGGLLHRVCQEDFSAVLTNGFDTLLAFNAQGQLLNHESLVYDALIPPFAPYRQGPAAKWAYNGNIVIALNRLGEISVFRDQKLLFARRSGKWHFLTHEPVISQMAPPANRHVRHAVYETCLDASFARTGACIGVVTSAHLGDWNELVPEAGDYIYTATSTKAIALHQMINGRVFQELDRRFRMELVAIDGATILDHNGNVLSVGAILRIPGGSTGGGRLAAAKALSRKGLGIKVSQDGGIRGFADGQADPKFSVM